MNSDNLKAVSPQNYWVVISVGFWRMYDDAGGIYHLVQGAVVAENGVLSDNLMDL
jgi:hypothetical protein